MSLHDVDRESPLRDSPSPTSEDNVQADARMAHQTTSTTYGAPGVQTTARIQQQNKRILAVDQNNVPVADFGQQTDGSIGLWVAKPGIDVTSATASQLVFNSSQDIFKIALTDTATIPAVTAPGSSSITYNHNLGYTPAVLAYMGVTGFSVQLPYNVVAFGGANDGKVIQQYNIGFITNTTINFTQGVGTSGGNQPSAIVRFFLLEESAT